MKEMEMTFFADTIYGMIRRALLNKNLKIEVKKGFGAMFG
jgi:hypothetical protein